MENPWNFGPWHPQGSPLSEDCSRSLAARLSAKWSPDFHYRVEVALKMFVDDTVGVSISPRDPFRAIMQELKRQPNELAAILRDAGTGRFGDLARGLARDYFERNAPKRREDETLLVWAVDVVRWMESEIVTIAGSPTPRGRASKQHLDNLMFASAAIALRSKAPLTLPGHDSSENTTDHPLFDFAKHMLTCGCEYGMQVVTSLPADQQAKTQNAFRVLAKTTQRGLIDSLEKARRHYLRGSRKAPRAS